MELSQAYLKSILNYDPNTGVFIRLVRAGHAKVGDIAGSTDKKGYRLIGIAGIGYKAHRLAWLYMTGAFPSNQIDHIDGEKANNRFSNLREATNAQNAANTPVRKHTMSGYKGAYFLKDGLEKPWLSQIKVSGKNIYLGMFKTKELAHEAYCKAAEQHRGDFAHY